MSNSRNIVAVSRMVSRQMSQAAVQEVPSPKFAKIKEAQKKFGLPDGTPVYLKGGFSDRILFITTAGLTVASVGLSVKVWYDLTFKNSA